MGQFPVKRFLRTPEAGRYLGLSGRTLEKHRTYGTGPIYRKLGGRVVYDMEDLAEWADRGLHRSTGESHLGPHPAAPRAEGAPPVRHRATQG
ncbi:helix-turn-helix transcriptional regulator [Brevundimonas sp. NPDC046655]|uniref:helix-turn-helix transcriptional regulator n=1 Tax=unclassified Brevundimonas TaxID=2622653 RepID=UPI00384CB15F